MSFLPIVLALFLIFLAYSIWTRSRNPYGLPQVSFNWPILIQFLLISRTKGTISRALVEATTQYRSKFGDIYVLPLFGRNVVVLCGDEEVNWAIKHERDDNLKRVLVGNLDLLLQSRNENIHTKSFWKKNREVLSTVLMQSTAINNFVPTMVTTIREHLSKSSVIDNNTLTNLVFDIGWLFIVGKRGKEFTEKIEDHYKSLVGAMMAMPVNLPGTAFRKGIQARAEIQKIINKIIEIDPTVKTDSNCCLGPIIESYPTQIDEIALGLLFASTSSTVGPLSGLVWTLINNPTILEKLQNEIRGVDCEPQSVADIHKFTYLDKVVHETLRLYGGGIITRETKVPIAYKNHVFSQKYPFTHCYW